MLTPDEIASRQFLIALRGYDRDEVQAFLNEVADERRQLQERIAELEAQLRDGPEAAPAATSVVPADDSDLEDDPVVAPADEVEATTADASRFAGVDTSEPRAVFAALGEETTRILVAAEESARSIRERAEERARTELESSRREARDEVAGARRTASKIISDAESRRNAVTEEIRRLETTRDRYAEDLRGAVVTVQNAMRSISTSGNASGGGREGESAAAPSASRTDADADDPARAGQPVGLVDAGDPATDRADDERPWRDADAHEGGTNELDADGLDADDLDADDLDADDLDPVVGLDSGLTDGDDDADSVLDRIEADIRAAEERRTDGLPDGPIDGDALTVATAQQHDEPATYDTGSGAVAGDAEDDDRASIAAAAAAASAAAAFASGDEDADADAATVSDEDTGTSDDDGLTDALGVEVSGDELDARAVDLRDAALSAVRPGVLRILKRSLQDVQNGVLDSLRRSGDDASVQGLLPASEELEGLGQAAQPHLATAHGAGVQDGHHLAGTDAGTAADAPEHGIEAAVDSLSDALGSDITTNLRASLTQGIAAGEAQAELGERVGDVFRDLKGATAEAIVDGELMRAYGWGLLAAWQSGGVSGKRWVQHDEMRCPEDMCQTNAGAGTLPLDASFPTGEVVPPPHDGCVCTLAPAS